MEPLSQVFLAAGTVFHVPQTWMAHVQSNKTDLKVFYLSRCQSLWSVDNVYIAAVSVALIISNSWRCHKVTHIETADCTEGNFQHKQKAIWPCWGSGAQITLTHTASL